jgi:hypothetical protein
MYNSNPMDILIHKQIKLSKKMCLINEDEKRKMLVVDGIFYT